MADKDPQQALDFILVSLSCAQEDAKIDWHAVAAKVNMTQARNVQQKFKKLIESTGKYALVNGKVLDLSADPTATPVTPKKPMKRAPATPRSGKSTGAGRKRKAKKDESDDDGGEEDSADLSETPVKKQKTTARRAASTKAQEKNRKQTEDDSDDDGMAKDSGTEEAAPVPKTEPDEEPAMMVIDDGED